jgi:hypothetical protein
LAENLQVADYLQEGDIGFKKFKVRLACFSNSRLLTITVEKEKKNNVPPRSGIFRHP